MRPKEPFTLETEEIANHILTIEDPQGVRNFLLSNVTYSLGRGMNNSIILRSNLVSRQHATLLVVAAKKSSCFFRIVDGDFDGKRSTNGILINGKRRFSHVLSHGDEIIFSKDTKATYQMISAIRNISKSSQNNISERLNFNKSDQTFDETASFEHSPLQSISDQNLSVYIHEVTSQITKQSQAEAVISYQVDHDTLTGLPNQKYLYKHLIQAVEKLENKQERFAVLFLDIDRFKLINDSLGHSVGDLLLKAVSDRLKNLLRKYDLIVRWGADEFAVVVRSVNSTDTVVQIAEAMIQSLTKPFICDGHEIHITTCIGASIYPDHNTNVEALIQNADMAMYKAKSEGQNSFKFYVPNMQEQSFQRLSMENNLRRAIENNELLIYYQPQIDLNTNKVVGLEVLIRWRHITLGSISPSKFIPLAEETGLIIVIGAWVLRQACLQAIAWQKMGLSPIRIGVNLSVKQLQQKSFLSSLNQILEETNLDPHCLELEITEGIMMDNVAEKIVLLNEFRKMGIRLSIDDFGTGYSSLSYLRDLPIDTLKIDRVFVEHIAHNKHDQNIVASIINLSHSLNLTVIAEGAETREQVDVLRSLGCDQIQGYFFYKPLPADEIETLLRSQGVTKPNLNSGS